MTIYNQLQFSVQPHYDENMTHAEQCQVLLFPNDYYEEKSDITSVYYRCSDKGICCARDHCCLKPDHTVFYIVAAVLGVIALLGVILLLYCCCCKGSGPSARQDYTRGQKADDDF